MRFKLTLATTQRQPVLPINYQYPLAAAIYRIIERADAAYSHFLHESGYSKAGSLKKFKLFTFSDIRVPFSIAGDRLLLKDQMAALTVCFHIPAAAENFIRGIFLHQEIEVADRKSKAGFTVSQVEAEQFSFKTEAAQEVLLQPLSPVVCGKKNERGNYDFLSPEHPEFVPQLIYNWKEKYRTVYGDMNAETAFENAAVKVAFYGNPPKSRLIKIKADTRAETQIRGFNNFRLKVHGQSEALELLVNSGVGIYNSLGMGCV